VHTASFWGSFRFSK